MHAIKLQQEQGRQTTPEAGICALINQHVIQTSNTAAITLGNTAKCKTTQKITQKLQFNSRTLATGTVIANALCLCVSQ